MKKLLLYLMLVAGGVLFGADELIDDNISPWEYWRKGFESFEQGEQLSSAKKYDESLAAYLNAKRAFMKVKQARPDWRQDVIMKRIKLCDEKIAQLEYNQLKRPSDSNRRTMQTTPSYRTQRTPRDGDDNFTFSSEGSTKNTTAVSESREIKLLKRRLKDYHEKLFAALVKLEDYRNKDKRSSSALAEIESLIKEKSVIKRKYQLLLEKYSILQQRQRTPQTEKDSLNNKLVEEKMRSDLLSQKIKMYLANIQQLQDDIITQKKNNRSDKFSVRKADARISALEDEIKRLNRNVSNYREQASKVSVELDKQKYINSIEQRNAQRYKARLAKMDEWLNNSDKSKSAAINQKIARENINITQQLSKLQSKNDTLLRESLTLKNKLIEEHANLTQLKNMLSSSEAAKQELRQRLKKSSDRALKKSGASNFQTEEIAKLRRENQQLREDLNLFGKSYSKRNHSGTSDAGTVSQYKLIIDKLNAQLANEKASSQQYKLTRKSQQQQLMKLSDENTKLKDDNLDLTEENKNLKTFVKDYDTVTKANDKLKLMLSKSDLIAKELNRSKQERLKLLKRNKTLSDKLAEYNKPDIFIPVKPPTVKKSQAERGLQQEIKRLQRQNSSMAAKAAEYSAKITRLEKEQENLAAHVGKTQKEQTSKAQHAQTAQLKQTIKQLQAKISSADKTVAESRQAHNTQTVQLKKTIKQLQAKLSSTEKTVNQAQKAHNDKTAKLAQSIKQLQATINSDKKSVAQARKLKTTSKKQLAEKSAEIARLETMLNASRKAAVKYQSQLKQRIQKAVKIKKTAPQLLPGKLSDHQIAFLLQEGIQAANSNDYEAAAWHYRKIITNTLDHPEANRRLGLINLNRGNYRKSAQQLEKALRAAPKDTELLLAFASALFNSGNNQGALATVKQAVTLTPDNSRVHILNGSILQQLKQDKAAGVSFRRALSLSPNSAEANMKLAQLLATDKKAQQEAGDCYRKALKLGAAHDPMLDKIFAVKSKSSDSEAVAALRQMAAGHEAQKDYVAAAWCYSQLLALDKNNPELKLKYGTILLLDSKPDKSLPLLQAAAKNANDKLTAQLLLGANYLLLNKTTEAGNIYRQALQLLKATPQYRQTVAVKQLSAAIMKKLGTKAGKEFKQVNAKLK
jgi:Tfp pilus assembly protein PilF